MRPGISFQQFFQEELLPELARLEPIRKKERNKLILFVLPPFAASLLITSWLDTNFILQLCIVLMSTFFLGIIPFAMLRGNKMKDLRQAFKESVMKPMVLFADHSLKYVPSGFIAEADLRSSGLFVNGNDYKGDDLVIGRAGESLFEFCEIESKYKDPFGSSRRNVNGRNRDRSRTIFHGLFLKVVPAYSFSGEIFIVPKMSRRKLKAQGINIFYLETKILTTIAVPSDDFERYFTVYSTNAIEANRFLSALFMKDLIGLREKMGKNLFFSQAGTTAYAAVSIYNPGFMRRGESAFFEPPLFRSLLNYKRHLRNLEIIEAMTGAAKMISRN